MKIENIRKGDTLVCVAPEGAGRVQARFFSVVKVNRVTIRVRDEQGREQVAYPSVFDRKAGA